MRTFEQYIREAVDFRLGGSAKKGDDIKRFADLEEGDKFYRYSVNVEYYSYSKKRDVVKVEGPEERTVFDVEKRQGYNTIKYEKDVTSFINISDKDLESNFSAQFGGTHARWANFYATYEMPNEEVKEICENILREKKKLRESVDFRLGGSQNKDERATFEDLDINDKVYLYIFTCNSKEAMNYENAEFISGEVVDIKEDVGMRVKADEYLFDITLFMKADDGSGTRGIVVDYTLVKQDAFAWCVSRNPLGNPKWLVKVFCTSAFKNEDEAFRYAKKYLANQKKN